MTRSRQGRRMPPRRASLGRQMPPRRAPLGRSDRVTTGALREPRPVALDAGLVAPAAALAGFGIVMVYSATAPLAMGEALPPHFAKHLIATVLALACVVGAARVPLMLWRHWALRLWIGCLVLLGATLLFGVEVNGAKRWLAIPGLPIHLQISELTKWATVLAVASGLTAVRARRAKTPGTRPLRVAAALGIPPVALLLLQPDFGSAALLVVLVAVLLFAAGTPMRQLALPAALFTVGAAAYAWLQPYALSRWKAFLDPWRVASSEGFQLVQSFVAFGRGGTLGVGIGDGRQKLYYLPEAHTDFILSVVAEEVGLLGVLAVLAAFAILMAAGCRIAGRVRDPFTQLVAFGMTTLIALPAALNAGVVMGVLPTTGMTLPFLSVGANSLIVCSLALGILIRIGSTEAPAERHRGGSASPRSAG